MLITTEIHQFPASFLELVVGLVGCLIMLGLLARTAQGSMIHLGRGVLPQNGAWTLKLPKEGISSEQKRNV